MSKPVFKRFSKARMALLATSSVSMMVIAFMLSGVSGQYKMVSAIQNGLQICGARVHTTYTAGIAGDMNSSYLDSNFTSQTGECFAQASEMISDYGKFSKSILKKVNAISSNVHWFHESLRSTGKGFSVSDEGHSSNMDEKFSQVEDSVEAGVILVENHVEEISQALTNIKIALALVTVVFLISFAWETTFRRLSSKRKQEVEEEALGLLMQTGEQSQDEIESIIINALELNEMKHCSKLFSTQKQIFKREKRNSTISANDGKAFGMLLSDNSKDVEDIAQKVWTMSDETQEENITESVVAITNANCEISSVNRFIACKVQDQFKDQGIEFVIDSQERKVKGDRETIEQIQYNILLDAAKNSLTASEDNRKIEIQGKTLGAIYYLSISSFGADKKGLEANTSVQVVKELLKDVAGRLELSNLYDDDLKPVGRKYKIILKTEEKKKLPELPEKTVTRVERGTKRELLERMM